MLRKMFSISPQFCLKSHFSNDHLFLFPVNVPLYIWMNKRHPSFYYCILQIFSNFNKKIYKI